MEKRGKTCWVEWKRILLSWLSLVTGWAFNKFLSLSLPVHDSDGTCSKISGCYCCCLMQFTKSISFISIIAVFGFILWESKLSRALMLNRKWKQNMRNISGIFIPVLLTSYSSRTTEKLTNFKVDDLKSRWNTFEYFSFFASVLYSTCCPFN